MTLAINFIIHGEAARFNRGKSNSDDFDFKYMKGPKGEIVPYVSSQCFKRYWREAIECDKSPITTNKNQAYTSGNPIEYIDDDLFGYMIAGAIEENSNDEEKVWIPEDLLAAKVELLKLAIVDYEKFLKKLSEDTKEPMPILYSLIKELNIDELTNYDNWSAEKEDEFIRELVSVLESEDFASKVFKQKANKKNLQTFEKTVDQIEKFKLVLEVLKNLGLIEFKNKIATTRRTAPLRMHAPVAFAKIQTAKDFQTFSRHVPYTGGNSVLNPNPVGFYSCWMKSRIIIETARIGKFYIGENFDILSPNEKIKVSEEVNPYSRTKEKRKYIVLSPEERLERYKAALSGFANIGNDQGPASGALHDGSLRPQGFIAANMNCCDSPFDYVWIDSASYPYPIISPNILRDCLNDAKDLFVIGTKIYIGLPLGYDDKERETIENIIKNAGFEPIVDTPRQTLKKLIEDASL